MEIISKKQNIIIYLLLFFLAFALRFPYSFESVICWDESTYIIMGQDLLNGNLPYVNLFEIKPPLTFLHYALFILLFGKSIVAVRLGGLLCVFLASCIIYNTGKKVFNNNAGLWSAICLIFFSSTVDTSAQAVMSEHLTLVPASLFLYFLSQEKYSQKIYFILGFLVGILALIRLNFVYLGPIFLLIVVLDSRMREKGLVYKYIFKCMLLYVSGFLLLPLCVWLIYLFTGNQEVLIKSVWHASLGYVSQSGSLNNQMRIMLSNLSGQVLSKNFFLWVTFVFGAILIYIKPFFRNQKRFVFLLLTSFFLIAFSILKTGREFPRYFIQLIPFMVPICGLFLSSILSLKTLFFKVLIFTVIVVCFLFPLRPIMGANKFFAERISRGDKLYGDPGYMVAEYLNDQNVSGKYVYFLTNHIGYFLTDARIPTKYVQPSNIAKDFLLRAVDDKNSTPVNELKSILKKEPLFIIKKENIWYFDKFDKRLYNVLDGEINANYNLDKEIGPFLIYKRKSLIKRQENS